MAEVAAPKRLRPEDYGPDIRAKLREVRAISGRLAKAAADSARRVELVEELAQAGVPVTAVARFAGVSSAALHKSKRRHVTGKSDPQGL